VGNRDIFKWKGGWENLTTQLGEKNIKEERDTGEKIERKRKKVKME
jgi:hypothetical protein